MHRKERAPALPTPLMQVADDGLRAPPPVRSAASIVAVDQFPPRPARRSFAPSTGLVGIRGAAGK